MHTIPQRSYHNPVLLERVNILRSEINVLKGKIEGFIANNLSADLVNIAIIECLVLAEELSRLENNLESNNPTELVNAHKSILKLALFLIPHSNPEKLVRQNISDFIQRTFKQAYPNFSYYNLHYDNIFYQWLRREGIGYKEPPSSGRYGPYELHFPVSDMDLDTFFQEKRNEIFHAMITDINPGNFFCDPFYNNTEAIEFYNYYNEYLQYSIMKSSPNNPSQGNVLRS